MNGKVSSWWEKSGKGTQRANRIPCKLSTGASHVPGTAESTITLSIATDSAEGETQRMNLTLTTAEGLALVESLARMVAFSAKGAD